jgi:hypothetical protein
MNEIESDLEKDDGVEQQLKYLTQHVRELRKENKELREKVDRIEEAVDGAAVTSEEKNQLRVEGMNGGPANPDIGKVMKKAKEGEAGVEVGKVETILDCSRRHALDTMRKIASTFDNYSFKRGSGNKPSKLKNNESAEDVYLK